MEEEPDARDHGEQGMILGVDLVDIAGMVDSQIGGNSLAVKTEGNMALVARLELAAPIPYSPAEAAAVQEKGHVVVRHSRDAAVHVALALDCHCWRPEPASFQVDSAGMMLILEHVLHH